MADCIRTEVQTPIPAFRPVTHRILLSLKLLLEILITKLVKKYGFKRGTIPHGLFRGVDRDVPTIVDEYLFIYCLKSQDAKLVRLIAEGLDKNSELFKHTRSAFYYERDEVWKNPIIPLHPAAAEYYRSKGYMGKGAL